MTAQKKKKRGRPKKDPNAPKSPYKKRKTKKEENQLDVAPQREENISENDESEKQVNINDFPDGEFSSSNIYSSPAPNNFSVDDTSENSGSMFEVRDENNDVSTDELEPGESATPEKAEKAEQEDGFNEDGSKKYIYPDFKKTFHIIPIGVGMPWNQAEDYDMIFAIVCQHVLNYDMENMTPKMMAQATFVTNALCGPLHHIARPGKDSEPSFFVDAVIACAAVYMARKSE